MKKTLFFVLIALALFCFISCDHLSFANYGLSGRNPFDTLNGKITSDGTSISFVLPAFPGVVSRNADPAINENQHFHVTLISEPDFITSRDGCAGETVTFEELTPGDYILKCKAWDDDSGLHFEGEQPVTVKAGPNAASLKMDFVTEGDYIKLEPTENGVKITIKQIDFDNANSISVFDYTGASDIISPYFGFELDDEKAAEIKASGMEYTFIWPFAPLKAGGLNRDYYVFQYQHVEKKTGNLVQELVCCRNTADLPQIDLSAYSKIESDYYTNHEMKTREIRYKNMSLDTLRQTVPNAIQDKVVTFRAILETWAGDFIHKGVTAWVTDSKVEVPKTGDFTDESSFFYKISKGNAVDLLTYSNKSSYEVDGMLTDSKYGNNITPNFRWQFSVEGISNGWFQLPPIKKMDHCEPFTTAENLQAVDITNGPTENILMDNGKPVLTVEKKDGIFSLVVNVPEHTTYMQIEESKTGNSYHFTKKQGTEGVLSCSGQEVAIPWAFYAEAGSYEFLIKYTANSGYKVGSATVRSDNVTGADFVFNNIDCKGTPLLGTDVVINADTFTVQMPSGKKIDDYTLAFRNTPPFIIQKTFVIYSLNFLNGSYDTYDIRLDITDDNNNPIRNNLCSYKLDIKANEMELYFCNNDETQENGFALYSDYYDPQTGTKTIEGIYNKTGLSGRPAMYTTGGLAFRLLDRNENYYDSGRNDTWYGEYRLPLWSREWDYNGEYPVPANQ